MPAPPAPSGDVVTIRRGCDSEAAPASATYSTPMGFNPYRQQKRRPSDYVMVAAAVLVVAALLAWALFA